MRVLLLSNEYPPYVTTGQGVHVEYLSKELAKSIDVEIRTFNDQNSSEDNIKVIGYNTYNKDYDACPDDIKPPLQALASCIDINGINPINADIVHCHTTDTFFAGVLAKLLYHIPLIVTVHSLEIKRPWRRTYFGATYDLYLGIEKETLKSADKVIAVSASVKDDILKMYPEVDPKNIEIIHNGIDVNEYTENKNEKVLKKYGIDTDKPYVLFMGAFSRQKGVQYLLKATDYFSEGLQLVICGRQSEDIDFYNAVVRNIEKLKDKGKKVIFIDKNISRAECIALYSSAAVFCCPSIYEPFGLINLEALACRTPIVASSIGGIREVLIQGEGGFLVEPGLSPNPPFEPYDGDGFSKRMSDAINRLAKDKNLRNRMGERGRERVEKVFSWQSVGNKTLSLYKDVISKDESKKHSSL